MIRLLSLEVQCLSCLLYVQAIDGEAHAFTSAKINISYSILFNLTTSYSSYFGGKKRISRNKTIFFLLMLPCHHCIVVVTLSPCRLQHCVVAMLLWPSHHHLYCQIIAVSLLRCCLRHVVTVLLLSDHCSVVFIIVSWPCHHCCRVVAVIFVSSLSSLCHRLHHIVVTLLQCHVMLLLCVAIIVSLPCHCHCHIVTMSLSPHHIDVIITLLLLSLHCCLLHHCHIIVTLSLSSMS